MVLLVFWHLSPAHWRGIEISKISFTRMEMTNTWLFVAYLCRGVAAVFEDFHFRAAKDCSSFFVFWPIRRGPIYFAGDHV